MTPRSKKPDEFDWRKLVNELEVAPFAEQDDNESSSEVEEEEETPHGRYTKLVFEVNLFTSEKNDRCFMIYSTQRMFDFGVMSLPDAIAKAKGKKR